MALVNSQETVLKPLFFDAIKPAETNFLIFPSQMLDGDANASRLREVWWGAHCYHRTGFQVKGKLIQKATAEVFHRTASV